MNNETLDARRAGAGTGERAVADAVRRALVGFLGAEVLALGELDPDLAPFAAVARDMALDGGKRLRPTFAYWGWRGVAGPDADPAAILPAFAALELLHTFALIHDDLMDRGTWRRGRPTAHLRYAGDHRAAGRHGDPAAFGNAAALLAGDLCLVWADRLMAEAAVAPEAMSAARRVYDAMRLDAMAGQYLDLLGETRPADWSTGRALKVVRYKSASYTVARPLQFGAALAGTDPAWPPHGPDLAAGRVARARPWDPGDGAGGAGAGAGRRSVATVARGIDDVYLGYGIPLGEAFQLRDDVLGVYGDPRTTGKPTGDDLRRHKPTVLVTLARERSRPEQVALIDEWLAADEVTDAQVEALGALIAGTGALDRVEQMISVRVGQAVGALEGAPVAPVAREALIGLATRVAYRTA